MKPLATLAMLAGILAVPALAQHVQAGGGPVSHAAPAPRGFTAPAPRTFSMPSGRGFTGSFTSRGPVRDPIGMRPRGFAPRAPLALRPGAPRSSLNRSLGFRPRSPLQARAPYRRFGAVPDGRHPRGPRNPHDPRGWRGPHDRGHGHHRMIYWNGGLYPYSYFYPNYPIFTGYVDPWLFGSDDYDYDQHQSAADYGAYPSDPQGPYAQPQDAQSAYGYGDAAALQPPYAPGVPASEYSGPQSTPAPVSGDARRPYTGAGSSARRTEGSISTPPDSAASTTTATTTLIFKDGRPPEQIHNYIMTAGTLTVLDAHYQQIPLTQVDLAATQAVNRAAGVNFTPPH